MEDETMEFLRGDKVPLGDNRSTATHRKTVFKTWFSYVWCLLPSWPLHSYSWKVIKIIISSQIDPSHPLISTTAFILATLTPVMEEHTKLIDCLSETSSQLIHPISHLSKEETSAKPNTSCFICVQVHSFASCNCKLCWKTPAINSTAEHSYQK